MFEQNRKTEDDGVEVTVIRLDDGTRIRYTEYAAASTGQFEHEAFDEVSIHVDTDAERFNVNELTGGSITIKIGGLFQTLFLTRHQAAKLAAELAEVFTAPSTAKV